MNGLVAPLARLGGAADRVASWAVATPGAVGRMLAVRRYRRVGGATAVGYVVVYLLALRDVAVSADGRYGRFVPIPSIEVVPHWTAKLFAARAPFLYEPVAAVHPIPQLAIFLSVGDIVLGSLLGSLLGLNVALAASAAADRRACRPKAYRPVFGSLPALLVGFSCCAPSLLLLFGTGATAAILPTFIALRGYLVPASLALMIAMLVGTARKMAAAGVRIAEGLAGSRATEPVSTQPGGRHGRPKPAVLPWRRPSGRLEVKHAPSEEEVESSRGLAGFHVHPERVTGPGRDRWNGGSM